MNDLLGDTADGRDLEKGSSSSSSSRTPAPGQDTAKFFQEINRVGSSISKIKGRLRKLENSNEDYRTATRVTAMKVFKEKMDKDLHEISVIAGVVKRKLEALDTSNAANRKIMNCQAGSSTDRMRTTLSTNLKSRLREHAVKFQELRQRFQHEHRELVERRLSTVTGQNVDESVIERLIQTGESEQIFENAILPQVEVQDAIAEIQEWNDAVKDIERKLHQIILDMEIIAEPQGELLDNIEAEVSNAVEHVHAGTAHLRMTTALLIRTNKRLIVFIILILLATTILLLTIFQPWKKFIKRHH